MRACGVFLGTLLVLLGGCGGNRIESTAVVKAANGIEFYGDSITCGVGASDYRGDAYPPQARDQNSGYAYQVAKHFGGPFLNTCRSGDQAFDAGDKIAAFSEPRGDGHDPARVVAIGMNDVLAVLSSFCSTADGCQLDYRAAMLAMTYWMALPRDEKVYANECQHVSGRWRGEHARPVGPVVGTWSVSPYAAIECSITTGRTLVVGWSADQNEIGDVRHSMKLMVDGRELDILLSYGFQGQRTTSFHGMERVSLAKSYAVQPGKHRVRFVSQCGDGCSVMPNWIGSPEKGANLPPVFVAGVPQFRGDAAEAASAVYDGMAMDVERQAQADGLNVRFVDTRILQAADYADPFHPNDAGHAKLAAAFLREMRFQ